MDGPRYSRNIAAAKYAPNARGDNRCEPSISDNGRPAIFDRHLGRNLTDDEILRMGRSDIIRSKLTH